MLFTKEEFDNYVANTFENIEDIPEDSKIFKDYCPKCKAVMGLEIEAKNAGATQKQLGRKIYVQPPNWDLPFNYVLKCYIGRLLNKKMTSYESPIGSLGIKWDPKNLEIQTKSVGKTLEPLVTQVRLCTNYHL